MSEPPLNTDDAAGEGNLTAEEYQAEHEKRAQEIGANGLHVVPEQFLAQIEGSA